jgi:hypothetical protein
MLLLLLVLLFYLNRRFSQQIITERLINKFNRDPLRQIAITAT